MADDVRVLRMLEALMQSGGEPEELCADCPELLPDLRAQWEQCRQLDDRINALFGAGDDSDSSSSARVISADPYGLPNIPGYELIAIEGRGGMGVVYRARHLKLNRIVALKMLVNGIYASPTERARFLREAQAVAALRHPNIVQVHDVGELGGRPYFTMEFVEGKTLAHLLAGVPQPPNRAMMIALTLADAIQSAHQRGIVHRDLKPANILLTLDETPKISDFGLAWRIEAAEALTFDGTRLGTPSYMAPEQAFSNAGTVGPATDVYALGAILYEMLTGRPPFRGESAAETERQLLAEDPVPPSKLNSRISRDLQTICMTCLQKEPRRRYSTAAALAEDLRRLQRGEPISARQTGAVERLAKWVRRHPTLTTLLLFISVSLAAAIGGITVWISGQHATNKVVEEQLREVVRFQQQGAWKDADTALERATLRLASNGPAALRKQLDGATQDSKLAARLDEIILNHSGSVRGLVNMAKSDEAYRATFSEFGIGGLEDEPSAVAARVKRSNIRAALVAALYDWSISPGAEDRRWLQEVTDLADDNRAGWHQRVRDPAMWDQGDKLAALAADAPVDNDSVAFLLAIASRLNEHGKETLPLLRRIQIANPDDFWANKALADELRAKKKYEDALRFYQAAVAIRPLSAAVHNTLGLTLWSLGRQDEAEDEYRRTIKLDPAALPLKCNLASALVWNGKYDEALTTIPPLLRSDPSNARIRCFYGISLEARGRPDEAIAQYRITVQTDPTHELAWKKLHVALINQRHADEAFAAWQQEINAIPKVTNAWEGYPEYCLHLHKQDAYERARADQLRTFEHDTDSIICERVGRTSLLVPSSPQMLQKATSLIESALKQQQGKVLFSYFAFSRGLAQYRAGQFDAAVATMSGAAAPTYQPGTALVQAMAEYHLGRVDQARARYERAVSSINWNQPTTPDHQFWMYEVLRAEADALIYPAAPSR